MRQGFRRCSVPGFTALALLLPLAVRSASLEQLAARPFAFSSSFGSLPVPLLGPAVPVLPARRPAPPGTPVPGETFAARVTLVSDGDTVHLDRGDKVFKARLAEVDAPEKAQPYGPEAGVRLGALVLNRAVAVKIRDVDRYGRIVVWMTSDGESVNRRLLTEGTVWWYRAYSKDPALGELEAAAKAARRGLWADEAPEAPWEYRRRNRGVTPEGEEPPWDPTEEPF